MQLTEQQFKHNDLTITKEYKQGKLANIWVQSRGGTVLFEGSTQEASDALEDENTSDEVLDALQQSLYEEVL